MSFNMNECVKITEYVSILDDLKYDPIIFPTRLKASETLDEMQKIINEYGFCSVIDMLDICGKEGRSHHYKFGWKKLEHVAIVRLRNGYTLGGLNINLEVAPIPCVKSSECNAVDTRDMRIADAQCNLEEIIEDLIKQRYRYADPIVVKLRETYELLNK